MTLKCTQWYCDNIVSFYFDNRCNVNVIAESKKKAIIWCVNPNQSGTLYSKVKTPKPNCKNTITTRAVIPDFWSFVKSNLWLLKAKKSIIPTTMYAIVRWTNWTPLLPSVNLNNQESFSNKTEKKEENKKYLEFKD